MRMLQSMFLFAVATRVAVASAPLVPPADPIAALVTLSIIEGGTVMSVPKTAKKVRGGKVVVVKPRAEQRTAVRPAKPATPAPAKSCTCAPSGGSSSDVMELRSSDSGLRVVIMGPDGLTRTRFVPAPPGGSTARHNQDE